MGSRGRKSSADMIVVRREWPVRPKPPGSLTATQRAIWQQIVNSEPAAAFRTAALRSLLANLCKHIDTASMLSSEIEAFDSQWLKDEDGLPRFDKFLQLRARETRSAADLMTKLRMTSQSRYTPQAAGTAAKKAGCKRPWEWEIGQGDTVDDTSPNEGGRDG